MKKALSLGMVLLAASGTKAWSAGGSVAGPVGLADGPLFFLGGAGTSAAHGAGFLGVDVRDVTGDKIAVLKLKEARGAEIILVDHDAPAGKAGLREHDVVLQMNGQAIAGEEQLRRMLRESAPGTTVVLVVSRDGQQMTVTAQMANREAVERQAWEQHLVVPEPQQSQPLQTTDGSVPDTPASLPPGVHGKSFIGTVLMTPAYTGAMLENLSPQLAGYFGVPNGVGLLVRTVEANSPAAIAGMQAGDVVVRADEHAVANTGDWAKAIKNSHGHSLAVVVLRDKKEQTLTLTPDGKRRSSVEDPADDSNPALARLGFSFLPRS